MICCELSSRKILVALCCYVGCVCKFLNHLSNIKYQN